ncbi:tetratricopeptide repeat protein [Novosphingobium sp.]|uniref:tetratricopeptide repeat protein n=1 Tax=Novosphingobium sp. TaxID=1874826 RepID=UPI003341653D
MTWVVILGLAAVVFALMAFVLKMPRPAWEIVGAALMLGLAGYAVQGHPGAPGAPKAPLEDQRTADAELLRQQQTMGDKFGQGQSWLVVSDALSRAGQFRAAADFLGQAVRRNPRDADLWVALGNALTGHSDGTITPAAEFAFRRAAAINPDHPGPPFFMGMALAQSGHLTEARELWAGLLQRAPANAPFRADLVARLDRLDQLIAMSNAPPAADGAPAPAPPANPQPAPASPSAPASTNP